VNAEFIVTDDDNDGDVCIMILDLLAFPHVHVRKKQSSFVDLSALPEKFTSPVVRVRVSCT